MEGLQASLRQYTLMYSDIKQQYRDLELQTKVQNEMIDNLEQQKREEQDKLAMQEQEHQEELVQNI